MEPTVRLGIRRRERRQGLALGVLVGDGRGRLGFTERTRREQIAA